MNPTFPPLFQTFKKLTNHPLCRTQKIRTVLRYLVWQFTSRLFSSVQTKPWVGGLKLEIRRGFHASTSCHYFGLPEFESMAFLLHLLRPGDLFVDAGANIGAYSLLASGKCGAKTYSFEPVEAIYHALERNLEINKLDQLVEPKQIGLGNTTQMASITTGHGIQNHITTSENQESIQAVQIYPLDDFVAQSPPLLMKIDVEGYETAVLQGAVLTLRNPGVRAIILERMGLGKRFGFDEEALHQNLLSFGFEVYGYQPFERKLREAHQPVFGNNIYLRDLDFVKERLATATKMEINGVHF